MKISAIAFLFIAEWLVMGADARNAWSLPKVIRQKAFGLPDKESNNREMGVEVVEPGLVIIRNFLSERECKHVAQHAMTLGKQGEDGFYTTNQQGEKLLNTGEDRGRIYDSVQRFKGVLDYCNRAVKAATEVDKDMPNMECTHVLLNMYTSSEGLVWHRDIYENDGIGDFPIVNLCVGATCVFGFRHKETDPLRTIRLRSGDVLLFGGPCRLIEHAVLEVDLGDCPDWMETPCRFSYTFRHSPEVIGREAEFKYFRVNEHLVGQETFQVPEDRKSHRGLPDLPTQHGDIDHALA